MHQKQLDYSGLEVYQELFTVDDAFSCLGDNNQRLSSCF